MTSQPYGELGPDEPSLMDIAADMDDQPGEAVEGEETDEEIESEEAPEDVEEEESEEDSEQEEEAPDEEPEIEVEGSKVKLSELKAGYMKDADYRRKTAEVAETKRVVEGQQQEIQQQREYYAKHTEPLLHLLREQLIGSQAELAKLAHENPAEWVAANQEYNQRSQLFEALLKESQTLQQQQQADEERKHLAWVKEQRGKLYDVVPEWKDEKRANAERVKVAEYLIAVGYDQKELEVLTDVRALRTALDAAKWREHQATVASAKSKKGNPEPPARVVKPGAAQVPVTQQQRRMAEANKRLSNNPNDLRSLAALARESGF